MAHFMSQRLRNQQHYEGPSWNELGRQMTGVDPITPIGAPAGPPGRWVVRANGERYFIPEPDPEAEVLPAPREGVWMTNAGGSRVFVPAPRSVAAAEPRAPTRALSDVSSTRPRTHQSGVDTLIAPPGWGPFLQRLAFATVLGHALVERAKYARCQTCQALSGSYALLWMAMIIAIDVSIIVLLLAMHRIWEQRFKPCLQEVHRRRVGAAQNLNARLFTHEERRQEHTRTCIEEAVSQPGVIDGEICSIGVRVVDVVAQDGNEMDNGDDAERCHPARRELQLPIYVHSAAAVDGFVEDVV